MLLLVIFLRFFPVSGLLIATYHLCSLAVSNGLLPLSFLCQVILSEPVLYCFPASFPRILPRRFRSVADAEWRLFLTALLKGRYRYLLGSAAVVNRIREHLEWNLFCGKRRRAVRALQINPSPIRLLEGGARSKFPLVGRLLSGDELFSVSRSASGIISPTL